MSKKERQPAGSSRRDFMKTGSTLLMTAGAASVGTNLIAADGANQGYHAFGSDVIKIGLIGCGGRGIGAATQALNTTSGPVELVAMGDLFADRLQGAVRGIKSEHGDKFKVTKETQFVGFDAYKGVLAQDLDLVILATPPGFRPLHFEAAINAGKHVFAEKPVAVDAPGVRRFLAANEKAKAAGLAVQVGLQRHHEPCYQAIIKQCQDGAIGDIVLTRAYWNNDGVWVRPREAKQTELEYQCRNWYYFNWLCGDHINEQHIHNLDVINWLMNDYPTEAQGQGGRQVRVEKQYGEIYDHHFVEFTYKTGAKLLSQCRHQRNTWSSVSEFAHGSKGHADLSGGKIYDVKGQLVWESDDHNHDGWQQEHHDLFHALRAGERPNEGDYGAKSTMTAIFGRMATYTGKTLTWDQAFNSNVVLCDVDSLTSFEQEPPVKSNEEGFYAIPTPGVDTNKYV